MSIEKSEQPEQRNEGDLTKSLREALADELEILALNQNDKRSLERFRKGIFFMLGEVTNTISRLIDNVSDTERRKKLRKDYVDILNRGA